MIYFNKDKAKTKLAFALGERLENLLLISTI